MALHFLIAFPGLDPRPLSLILDQNPSVTLDTDSTLANKIMAVLPGCPVDDFAISQQILSTVVNDHAKKYQTPDIIDFSNHWLDLLKPLDVIAGGQQKIVCLVADVDVCAALLVKKLNPVDLEIFLTKGQYTRELKNFYVNLLSIYTYIKEKVLFVDYFDLLDTPATQIDRVTKFLDLDECAYDFSRLEAEEKPESKKILAHRHRDFVQARFWLGENATDSPPHDLDLQLDAGLRGDFDLGWKLAQKIEQEEPWNNRAAFNRGWYLLRQGRLLEGERLMSRGREEEIFGNPAPTAMPVWDGKTACTVLLSLEGGLGDQIHGARYAEYIAGYGCKVLVAADHQLVPLFEKTPGITALLRHEASAGVLHDAWVPSMSAVPILGLEYSDIKGGPYINRPVVPKSGKFRIGLRWQGNPRFEHEQHRLFPHHLLFDAVKDQDVEYISLQRDQGSDHRPYWVTKVPLENWKQTQDAVASCDLVISSCTSVAHFSAAMGIPTWIVVPILPYYLWALPGETSPWYDSVRLYRQERFGHWEEPFIRIKENLVSLLDKEKC